MGTGVVARDRTRAEAAQLFCCRDGVQAGHGSSNDMVAPSQVDAVVR